MEAKINANMVEPHGKAIVQAAYDAGFDTKINESGRLDIADACALVDHESGGGQNIFGWDWGVRYADKVPFAHLPVTRKRVDALIAHIRSGGWSNGIGLTQLTYPTIVYDAEKRGGVHLPEHQLRVGFEHLASLVGRLGYMYGIAAYNAGEGNAQLGVDNGYYAKIQEARKKWKGILTMATDYNWKKYGWYECSNNANLLTPRSTTDANGAGTWKQDGYYVLGSDGSAMFNPAPAAWQWPVANTPPRSGSYQDRHPTRYNWRSDVEAWARYLVDNYNVWCNTYYDHPETWWRDTTSFDVWGAAGRNDPLPWAIGDKIFNQLFYSKSKPDIEWIIWRRRLYSAANNWQGVAWGSNAFEWHDDHIHVTYW